MKHTDKKSIVVGISGIMGSGKSTVARTFEDLGAKLIDADEIGKDLLREAGIRSAIIEAFGNRVKDTRGAIDTTKLAAAAFKSEESVKKLNDITRDALVASIRSRIGRIADSADIIVVDAALLPEWGFKQFLDVLIVVDAREDSALHRSSRGSRFEPATVRARMDCQFSRREKAACADIIIPNYGSLEDLRERAAKVFLTLMGIVRKG